VPLAPKIASLPLHFARKGGQNGVAKYARSFYDVQQSVFPSLRGDMKGMRLLGASEIGQKEEERRGVM